MYEIIKVSFRLKSGSESCTFMSECTKHEDVICIHKEAEIMWKIKAENQCTCKCVKELNKKFNVKSCSYNTTHMLENKIEMIG